MEAAEVPVGFTQEPIGHPGGPLTRDVCTAYTFPISLGCKTEPTAEDQDMAHWWRSNVQVECRRNSSQLWFRRTCSFPHIHLQGVRLLDIGAEVASTIEQYTVGFLQERRLRNHWGHALRIW